MAKDYYKDEEEIYDDIEKELTKEQLELLEIEKEQSTEVRNGQVEFASVNHSERANKFGRASDGDITEYANIALEYFGHRCALSGERFVSFDEKVNGKKQNLSAEHVVALCLGGDDIVPNIVPTVLQYNLRKNGYYLLDYWDKQKDTEGKSLYSPYRLLKLVNYMIKSIEARGLNIEEYRKSIMTPNEIDKFLAEIEKQDELEPDNSKKKIHSDTITATTLDEDDKKILTEIPSIEGNIPTLGEQQEKHREIKMMDIFLSDAVGVLKREQDLQQVVLQDKDGNEISLQDKLDGRLEKSIKEIRFEVEVRNAVLQKLEELGIENNKYSVANDWIRNSEILDLAKENRENVNDIVEEYLSRRVEVIKSILKNNEIVTVITNRPSVIYKESVFNILEFWKKHSIDMFEKLLFQDETLIDETLRICQILKDNRS